MHRQTSTAEYRVSNQARKGANGPGVGRKAAVRAGSTRSQDRSGDPHTQKSGLSSTVTEAAVATPAQEVNCTAPGVLVGAERGEGQGRCAPREAGAGEPGTRVVVDGG